MILIIVLLILCLLLMVIVFSLWRSLNKLKQKYKSSLNNIAELEAKIFKFYKESEIKNENRNEAENKINSINYNDVNTALNILQNK